MKKYLITTIVLVTVLVPSAFAVNNSLGTDVAKLKREMKAVQGQVATLRGQLAAVSQTTTELAAFAQCIRSVPVVPITQYGQPSQGNGYLYGYNDRPNLYLETALDATTAGDPVHFRAAAVNPQCVQAASVQTRATGNSERHVGKLTGHSWRKSLP